MGLAKVAVQWLIEHFCFVSSVVLIENFVLRIRHLRQAPERCTSPYWDTAFQFDKTQNFALLPDAIFSTWQGTQNPDTMQTLPRAKNANPQPAHPR